MLSNPEDACEGSRLEAETQRCGGFLHKGVGVLKMKNRYNQLNVNSASERTNLF